MGVKSPLLLQSGPGVGPRYSIPWERTKVGEAVGGRVISAFRWHQDVVALEHPVHQRAGETHTRGSQGIGCRAWGRSLLGWGAGWSGRSREGEEEKLGLSTLLLPTKGSLEGHFSAQGHAERARGCGLGLSLQKAFRLLQAVLVRTQFGPGLWFRPPYCPCCF